MSRRAAIALTVAGSTALVLAGVLFWGNRRLFDEPTFRATAVDSLREPSSVAALTSLTFDEVFGDDPALAAFRLPAEAAIAANLALPEVRVVLDDLAGNLYDAVAERPQPVVIEFSQFTALLRELAAGVSPDLATLIPADIARVELFAEGEVTDLSGLRRGAAFGWVASLIAAAVLLAAAVAGSRSGRVAWIGFAVAGAAGGTLIVSEFGRWFALRAVDHPDGRIILANAYDALAQSLVRQSLWLMVGGAVVYAAVRIRAAVTGPATA